MTIADATSTKADPDAARQLKRIMANLPECLRGLGDRSRIQRLVRVGIEPAYSGFTNVLGLRDLRFDGHSEDRLLELHGSMFRGIEGLDLEFIWAAQWLAVFAHCPYAFSPTASNERVEVAIERALGCLEQGLRVIGASDAMATLMARDQVAPVRLELPVARPSSLATGGFHLARGGERSAGCA